MRRLLGMTHLITRRFDQLARHPPERKANFCNRVSAGTDRDHKIRFLRLPDTILDGSGEQTPGRQLLDGTDLEIAYSLLGDDLVLRVNKAGVQVFGVVLENARKELTAKQLLELKYGR